MDDLEEDSEEYICFKLKDLNTELEKLANAVKESSLTRTLARSSAQRPSSCSNRDKRHQEKESKLDHADLRSCIGTATICKKIEPRTKNRHAKDCGKKKRNESIRGEAKPSSYNARENKAGRVSCMPYESAASKQRKYDSGKSTCSDDKIQYRSKRQLQREKVLNNKKCETKSLERSRSRKKSCSEVREKPGPGTQVESPECIQNRIDFLRSLLCCPRKTQPNCDSEDQSERNPRRNLNKNRKVKRAASDSSEDERQVKTKPRRQRRSPGTGKPCQLSSDVPNDLPQNCTNRRSKQRIQFDESIAADSKLDRQFKGNVDSRQSKCSMICDCKVSFQDSSSGSYSEPNSRRRDTSQKRTDRRAYRHVDCSPRACGQKSISAPASRQAKFHESELSVKPKNLISKPSETSKHTSSFIQLPQRRDSFTSLLERHLEGREKRPSQSPEQFICEDCKRKCVLDQFSERKSTEGLPSEMEMAFGILDNHLHEYKGANMMKQGSPNRKNKVKFATDEKRQRSIENRESLEMKITLSQLSMTPQYKNPNSTTHKYRH